MSKNIATIALAAAMAVASIVPAAQAGDYHRGHARYAYGGHHHRGHGHWHNGKWIALGILGAAVGAAIADSESRHCWYEYGRRYCD